MCIKNFLTDSCTDPASQCVTFGTQYKNGSDMCRVMWGDSLTYSTDMQNCFSFQVRAWTGRQAAREGTCAGAHALSPLPPGPPSRAPQYWGAYNPNKNVVVKSAGEAGATFAPALITAAVALASAAVAFPLGRLSATA